MVIYLRTSRSWASMRRRSARCSAARSCQAAGTWPAGDCASRMASARAGVMTPVRRGQVSLRPARTAPLDEYVRAASFDAEPARIRNFKRNLRRAGLGQHDRQARNQFGLTPGPEPETSNRHPHGADEPATYQTFVGEYD
jgi:hypothetical protein